MADVQIVKNTIKDKLKKLIEEAASLPYLKVGILSESKAKNRSIASNVKIGVTHEYGSVLKNIPPRSFLNMPLQKFLRIEKDKDRTLDTLIYNAFYFGKGFAKALKRIGMIAEGIIDRAFTSSGFGMWPKKKSGEPSYLIDTGELRKSVTSKVIEK